MRRDGSRLLVALAVTALLLDPAGAVKGFLGVVVDITHRKRAEALEVAQRTAEASSQASPEFLSRMSHELRSPLNAMLGYAQLIPRSTGTSRRVPASACACSRSSAPAGTWCS